MLLTGLSRFYGVLWLLVLWLPLGLAMHPSELLRHFTWWCWVLQAAFYTLTHPFLRSVLHLRHYWLILGCTCGNVIFVLTGFCLVLLQHPTIVVEVQGLPLGVVQLANVGLHYLTVMAFLLWTLFDVDHLRHMLRTQVHTRKRKALFVLSWVPLPLLYLAVYGPRAIADSYGIPYDASTVSGLVGCAALSFQFNLLYLVHLEG